MGDRAVVVMKETTGIKRTVHYSQVCAYLHSCGSRVLDFLVEAVPRMRQDDVDYSRARFIGVCHEVIEGNTGLGVFASPGPLSDETNWEELSEGDAGVVVLDITSGHVNCFAGYLERDPRNGTILIPELPE